MEKALTVLIPSLVERGLFGDGKFVAMVSDDDKEIGFQFGSVLSLVKIKLRLHNGDIKEVPLVVKVQMDNEVQRRVRDMASMFHNEVTMYKEVLPFLNPGDFRPYPDYFYGFATVGEEFEKDILILGNMKYSGYTLCKNKIILDYEHIVLAMKRIAELHSWSYTAKNKKTEDFNKIKNKLRPVVQQKDEDGRFEEWNYESMKVGLEPFIKEGREAGLLQEFIKIVESIIEVRDFISEPVEPFGVIIHGDFCKNNVFYKYNQTGKPIDLVYFDLQLSKYGSPVVDLSFFLYMHTTKELRDEHWDNFLEIYWKSVRDNVPSDVDIPSHEEFLEYFASKAVYGYFPCSFFIPMMMEENLLPYDEFEKLSPEGQLKEICNMGGEAARQAVVDMVSHLIDKKYVHKFIEYYSKAHAS